MKLSLFLTILLLCVYVVALNAENPVVVGWNALRRTSMRSAFQFPKLEYGVPTISYDPRAETGTYKI